MRAGVFISAIGHAGAVMMTFLAWEARPVELVTVGSVVPVEIVDVAAESNVRALAVPEEEEKEPEAAPQASEEEDTAPEPAPAPRERQRQQRRNDDFDLAEIAGMINRDDEPGRRRNEGARSDRNQQGAGLGTAEVASLQDRVRAVGKAHLRNCWRMPIDLPNPEELRVTVEFELNRNGTLNGQPRVTAPRNYTFNPHMRRAAEEALRAVRQCDPFPFASDQVLSQHYAFWREQRINFGVDEF